MKRFFTLSFIILCLGFSAKAQAPQGINYQGVARGLDGQPLSQKEISVRISVLNGSANGDVEYDEIHEIKTNNFGLFSLVIGNGTPGIGSFNFIGWTAGNKWLQVELDENGGRNFKLMGSQQFMSVPYALYAERSGNGYQAGQGISINNNTINNTGDGDASSTNELVTEFTFGTDSKLRLTDAGGTKEADLSGLIGASQDLTNVLLQGNDAGGSTITNLATPSASSDAATKAYVDNHADGDASPTNEIQNLSQVLGTGNDAGGLKINNLGAPTLSTDAATKLYVDGLDTADGDKNATNEIQTLSKTGATISLSAGGGSVALNDDSNTNEAQSISRTGSNVTLTQANGAGGGTFSIDDADASPTNEAQTLSRTGSNVSLTQASGAGGGTVSIDDADANATNEAQTLSKTGANISLTNVSGVGGGSIVLNDDSNTNEAQTISRTGSNVTLTQANGAGGGTFSIDDADASATNEAQTLSRTGSNITLTQASGVGGGTVSIDDADANPTNEAQTIARVGNTVTLTNVSGSGGGSFTVDPDATNELQNLGQVLSTGNNGGGSAITNIANPTNAQDATTKNYVDAADAAINARIATTYAFKVTYNHTHTAPTTQVVTITSEDFDDFSLISGNNFIAPENGTYQFTVSGTSPLGGIAMQIRITPTSGPTQFIEVKRQLSYPNSSIINYFESTIVKLSTGDVVDLIVLSGITNEVVIGSFSGFKL